MTMFMINKGGECGDIDGGFDAGGDGGGWAASGTRLLFGDFSFSLFAAFSAVFYFSFMLFFFPAYLVYLLPTLWLYFVLLSIYCSGENDQ